MVVLQSIIYYGSKLLGPHYHLVLDGDIILVFNEQFAPETAISFYFFR